MSNNIVIKYTKGKKLILGIPLIPFFIYFIGLLFGTIANIFYFIENPNLDGWEILSAISGWIALYFGIIAVAVLNKKWKWSWVLLFIEAIFLGIMMMSLGVWGVGILNFVVIPIILLMSHFITWKKEASENKIKTKQLKIIDGLIITATLVIVAFVISSLILLINPNSDKDWATWIKITNGLMDGAITTIGLFAFIGIYLKYRETFYLFFMSNVLKIILFSIMIAFTNEPMIISLILASVYLANSIYGMIAWQAHK